MVLGVVDRIVDGKVAVIIIEGLGKELDVPLGDLPLEVTEGDWLNIKLGWSGVPVEVVKNEQETLKRKERIKSKMDRLKRRSGSKYRNK